MSPLFLEFLMGDRKYECTPWGSPAYNIFGWQRPCYLLQDGYAETFKELMETTRWEEYGVASGNTKCANCMVSCGYEPTAVIDGFLSMKGFIAMARGWFGSYKDEHALKLLSEPAPHGPATLVQIGTTAHSLEETNV
jgi:hypothetical protein